MGGHVAKNNPTAIHGVITSYFYRKYSGTCDWQKKIQLLDEFTTTALAKKTVTVQNKYQRTRLLNDRTAVVEKLTQKAAYCRARVNDEFIIAGSPALAFAPDAYLDQQLHSDQYQIL